MLERFKNMFSGGAAGTGAASAAEHKARGLASLDQGNWREAAAHYRAAIAADGRDVDAHVNLGYALLEQGDQMQARQALEQALNVDAGSADALYMLGGMAQARGDAGEAIRRWEELLERKPDFERVYGELCRALLESGQAQRARQVMQAGVERYPERAEFHGFLGNLQAHVGDNEAAVQSYRAALALAPDSIDSLFSGGNALVALKRYAEAADMYRAALRLRPEDAFLHSNLGRALQGMARYPEALDSYQAALRCKPDFSDALFNYANVLDCMGQPESALQQYRRLLDLDPSYVDAWCNGGNVLRALGRMEEALESYGKALALAPDRADILNNRGAALSDLNRYDEALERYAAAQRLSPGYADAQFNESLCRLLQGDFEQGWKKYEARWGVATSAARRMFARPLWLGREPLDGKTILLYPEQGLGDAIQFVRYVPLLASRGAKVVLEVPSALRALLSGMPGAARVIAAGEPLPDFDFHCPLLSLPLAFGTGLSSIPAEAKYLSCDPARAESWAKKIPADRARVGLVWSGSTVHKNDRNRSVPLAEFSGLLGDEKYFVSLQKEIRTEDAALLGTDRRIAHFETELKDFSDTAALIANMDLVISVDTSVAHLAGAMGKPVWLLVPANPDWRWMTGRDDSPWYPSMRLFRQERLGEWRPVIAAIADRLARWHKADV